MPVLPRDVEIIRTDVPTTFSWKYRSDEPGLRRLYGHAKRDQWDGTTALDWSRSVEPEAENLPDSQIAIYGSPFWDRMTARERARLRHESMAWVLSQFLHGEQGALLATAQLVDSVPDMDAKLYAATQVVDEARHVEVYDRYLREKLGKVYAINPDLKILLDQILSDSRWDMKSLGMQILVEGLALAAFSFIRAQANEPLIRDLTALVMRDEARHVAFGVLSLRNFYRNEFTAREIRERQEFTYEACVLMRDRFMARDVWETIGLPVEECCRYARESAIMLEFRRLLFAKIVPNVKKLGLLDGWLRARFAELGILQYEDFDSDDVPYDDASPAFGDTAALAS
jgi:hypothetical protein